ncbi:hypothetical protein Tco_0122659 [Tanacetum coccineum]
MPLVDKLRVVVFPISLVGDAWKWFDGIKGSITSWVDLTGNFFRKYYPPSRTGGINNLIIKWDPTNPKFENWLASKFVNYKMMDIFTKGALWDYWKLVSDEIKPTNDETSDLEETNHDDEQEISEIFRIETNLLLTKDIKGFKTYEEFKDNWIYEWNNDVPWEYEKPWTNYGAWNEPTPITHCCKPFNYKTRCSEWPTCGWREDRYCNGGNLPGAYIIGNSLHYQDYEWYEALEDGELKEEALRNKAIMEGTIYDDDESSYERRKLWNVYDDTNHDHEYEIDHEVMKDKRYVDLAERKEIDNVGGESTI